MAGGGTFRATRGKGSRRAKSRSLQTRTSQTPSSPPTILLQPQCPVSSGTNASISPQILSQTPHESTTVVEVGESSTHAANIDQDSPQQTREPRAPRGAYLNKNIPTVASKRKVIHIYGLNYLEPEVPRMISKDFKGNFYGKETRVAQT